MYSLLKNGSWRELLRDELPALFGAGFVAEVFFKWHSFTLECLGFLGVWFVLGWARSAVRQARTAR